MKIHITNRQKDLEISPSSARFVVKHLIDFLKISCDEVSFHFVSRKKICALHKQFFDDPSSTDCITLPIDSNGMDGYCMLGEVFICPQTAIEYCHQKNTSPYVETTLYLVHGLLHLIGYEDIDPLDRKKMKRKERQCMSELQSRGILLKEKKDCTKRIAKF